VSSRLTAYDVASADGSTPLLLGYIRRDLLVTDGEVDRQKHLLESFAVSAGYRLVFVYVEQRGYGDLSAFRGLLESTLDGQVAAVVVPTLLHFSGLGHAGGFAATFEQFTGARVLTAASP
jgi:DNA invertase Pin-like site-specific DNA recombinase